MHTRQIKAGSVDQSVTIRIIDSTDGTPETGVVFNTSGIDMEYRRTGAVSVDITEATLSALTDAHTDGGFLHIGNGYYRLDLPDAAVAASAATCLVHGTVTGMIVIGCMIELVAYDPYDTVRLGLTAMPNVASGSAGALIVSGTGTAALSVSSGLVTLAGVTHTGAVIPTVTTATTATNVTTVNGLAAGVITATSIASDAITAAKIADGAIDAATFAAGAITATVIATGAIDADALAADAATEIAVAVTANQAIETGTLSSITATGATLAGTFETTALIGATIEIESATTGARQSRSITANTGSAFTVDTWAPALTGTVTYTLWAGPPAVTAASVATAVRAELTTELGRIDVAVSSRSSLSAADVNAQADLALADLGLDATVVTKMAGLPAATAGTNGGLPIVDAAGHATVDVFSINDIEIQGAGTAGDKFRPV